MIGRTRMLVAAGCTCAALLAPGVAQARTKLVIMGTPPSAQQEFQETYSSDVNAFFPRVSTVHVGDSVRFTFAGFHTIDFPARGEEPLSFAAPGNPVTGSVDANGAAFWFNGQPQLGFNPALAPQLGKTFRYNGSRRVTSGLPLVEGRPAPVTVRFPRRGSYEYYCNLHPGMEGIVRVLPKARRIPNTRQDRARVRAQLARAESVAEGLADVAPPPGVIHLGNRGAGNVEFFGMVPASITVPAGTTLRFAMPPQSSEVHTATFGPGDPENDPASYLGQIAAGFNAPQFDPRATYMSEPPGTTATLSPALHGNGFWNTGVLDGVPASPLPDGNAVTFGTPGTYTYYCLIHPFMKGTVVVQ